MSQPDGELIFDYDFDPDVYDIICDAIWVIGPALLHDPHRLANIFMIPIKPKWDKHKTVHRLFQKLEKRLTPEIIFEYLSSVESSLFRKTFELDCNELLESYLPEKIALCLRFTDKHAYMFFIQKHLKKIKQRIEENKLLLLPYTEDSQLAKEIIYLRESLAKAQDRINQLEIKIAKEQQEKEELLKRAKTPPETKEDPEKIYLIKENRRLLKKYNSILSRPQEKEAPPAAIIVQYPDGSGVIANHKITPVSYEFIQQNRLLHGDTVKIKSENPLKVSLLKPSPGRKEIVSLIKRINDTYIVRNNQEEICIGKTNKYLPEGATARVTYAQGFGIVTEIIHEKENNASSPATPVSGLNICVIGGVKESIYRDAISPGDNLLWVHAGERRRHIIQTNIQKADIVIIIAVYVNHVASNIAQELAKLFEKPLLYVSTSGQSGFKEAYKKIKTPLLIPG